MSHTKKPFCVVPFTTAFNTSINTFRDCCSKSPRTTSKPGQTFEEWWTGDAMHNVRQELLADTWPTACNRCQLAEQVNGQSFRLASNQQNSETTDYSWPNSWNIKFGNLCNLACWICNELDSTVIYNHKRKANLEISEDYQGNHNFESAWQDLEYSILKSYEHHKIVSLTLLGGEPLYNKIVIDFLQKLIDSNLASRTKLEFHTNGTVTPEKVLPKRDQGPWHHVCMFVSLDATDKYAEWLRYGCNWNKIKQNMELLQECCNYLEIHCTVSALNINQLPSLQKYADSINVECTYFPLHDPPWLNLEHWDLDKDKLLVHQTCSKFDTFYSLIGTKPIIGTSQRIKNYIRSFDSVRKPLAEFDMSFAEIMDW